MKILLATANEGKVKEYRHLLRGAPVEILTLQDLQIEEKPEETGETFEENAVLKARFYYGKGKMVTLADDGGLEIDALGGEPGVRSHRWLGREATDEERAQYALERMKGVPRERRGARFRAVLAIARSREEVRTFEGVMEGSIAEEIHEPVIPGYPYRSVFLHPETGQALSEIAIEELLHAHREQAVAKALPYLLGLEEAD